MLCHIRFLRIRFLPIIIYRDPQYPDPPSIVISGLGVQIQLVESGHII